MIKITHEFATLEEAITHLATMKGTKTPATVESATKATKAATDKKPDTPPADKPKAEDKKPEDKKPDAPDYASVAAKIAETAKTHRAELVALLGKFGAKTGKELKPEDYAKFTTEIDAITAPADDLS